jgi:clan AA aspartic protease (TIGR02281 family)
MNDVYSIGASQLRALLFAALVPFSCFAENYVQYASDAWGTYYVDRDELKLVTRSQSLVYATTKGVYPSQKADGAAYYLNKILIDCSRRYYDSVSWSTYTFDNVPIQTLKYKQLNEAVDYALMRSEDPKRHGELFGDELQRLCRIVARWVYDYAKGTNVRALIEPVKSGSITSVPVTKSGGVYRVKATVNSEVALTFVVDSGAADVVLPEYIGKTLFATGSITKSDILGVAKYVFANGDSQSGTVVNLKSLTIGDVTVRNVRASILPGDGASLLLGQSALKKLGAWRINAKCCVSQITPGLADATLW